MGYCLGSFLLFIGLFLAMKSCVVVAKVTSQSMLPTLKIGDCVLAFRYWPHHWLHKGQIVIIRPTKDYPSLQMEPFGEIPLIKRVTWVKGALPAFAKGEIGFPDEWRQSSDWFIVNGDLSLIYNKDENSGIIPYGNLLAVVFLKIPCRKTDQSIMN